MGFDEIIYEKANRVAVITLNRPARLNAWTASRRCMTSLLLSISARIGSILAAVSRGPVADT